MFTLPVIFLIAIKVISHCEANVLPAYTLYQDTIKQLEEMSTDEMIDMLGQIVDRRMKEEEKVVGDAFMPPIGEEGNPH